MSPDRITIEKDNVALAEVNSYRMAELTDDRFELTLEKVTPLPGSGNIHTWKDFKVTATIGSGLVTYAPCRWTRIHQAGTIDTIHSTSMTVIAYHREEITKNGTATN